MNNEQLRNKAEESDISKAIKNETVNLLHYEILYNSMCTGRPGLVHIMKTWDEERDGSYCGFRGFASQHVIVDHTDTYIESQICKKCLAAFIKSNQNHNIYPFRKTTNK